MGDIHGHYDKLLKCLKEVNFNNKIDTLIQLGDVVDRGKQTRECVSRLLKINNLIAIKGNHDKCWLDSITTGHQNLLFDTGGKETRQSYYNKDMGDMFVPKEHLEFFKNQKLYHKDENDNLFIHGGFNRHELLSKQDSKIFLWDRDLFLSALSFESMKQNEYPFKYKEKFNEIFVGHTPTTYWKEKTPIHAANIWNLDTGSGKGGLLTIMDLETKQFWQA